VLAKAGELSKHGASRCYSVYGLRLRTTIPLTLPEVPTELTCDTDVLAGDPAFFEESARHLTLDSDWAQIRGLSTGWIYARFGTLFDFLVSRDGSQILYRPLSDFVMASFEAYLLGMLMKIVLVRKGIQSLHASAVIINDTAVAFLGSGGFGKSSLAASFVSAGYPLLTDDVLRLEEDRGRMWAYPGPACLKLLPDDARQWLDESCAAVPMDPGADKWLFPMTAGLQCQTPVPLAAIYCMAGPKKAREAKRIAIDALKPREALLEIVGGAHKDNFVDRDRLAQRFDAAELVVKAVPVRRLTYPWSLASLPNMREAILSDVRGI
jgi:hypothetical protein